MSEERYDLGPMGWVAYRAFAEGEDARLCKALGEACRAAADAKRALEAAQKAERAAALKVEEARRFFTARCATVVGLSAPLPAGSYVVQDGDKTTLVVPVREKVSS
jgi:hypothetical protein